MAKRSIEFDIKVKDFKFSNENFFKGANIIKPNLWKKVAFTHHIDNLKSKLISQRERVFEFHFILEMKPDLGEINFDGECVLESPEQNKVNFILQNSPDTIKNFIIPFILKYSYHNVEKIGKKEGLPFPPVNVILKQYGIN
ncbi:hypothetical protein ES705_16879 [subsurface metagenome]